MRAMEQASKLASREPVAEEIKEYHSRFLLSSRHAAALTIEMFMKTNRVIYEFQGRSPRIILSAIRFVPFLDGMHS